MEGQRADPQPLRVLGIAGSLRRESWNRKLLRAAVDLAPEDMRIEVFDIADVPLYSGDLDGDEKPAPVAALKRAIGEADGLLVVSPEYNYGIPGVLKNALDWASRPGFRSELVGKPSAVMGASPGAAGTVRAQADVRRVLLATLSRVLPYADVAVPAVAQKFDAEGRLADAQTEKIVRGFLVAFRDWIRQLKAGQAALL